MKILLTHGYFLEEDTREQKIMKPYPPLGILSVSAYLEGKRVEHEVFDSTFSSYEELIEKISEFKPEIVGIYCNLMTKVNIVKMMKQIRSSWPDITVVVGGPDVRYNAGDYLNCGAHYGVIGEGEISFYKLVEGLNNTNDFEPGKIQGIAYLDQNRRCVKTPERPLIRDIDELPFPAFHKIDVKNYLNLWKKHHGQSMLSVSTQRGCPYTCKWCSTAVYGQSYRRKSPERVARELIELQTKYKPDAIWFVDDVFTVSHKWLRGFVDVLKERSIKIRYECITRADRMNEEVIEMLRESGCFRVWIGAESGSQRILDAMDRRVEVGQVREMIRKSSEAGIETGTFIMLGYPGETMKDIQATIDHLVRANPDHFTITLAYPIKGTALYYEVEVLQTKPIDWPEQTDRERSFRRSYSDRFYKYAIRKVVNEVGYRQEKVNHNTGIRSTRLYLKAKGAGLLMRMMR